MFTSKPNPPTKIEADVKQSVESILELEDKLANVEQQMLQNDQFKAFITAQRKAQDEIAVTWKAIESQMIKHNIKNIKGDWGTLTIAQRQNWEIDESKLPDFFFKRVPDTKKIADAFKLTSVSPKGVKRSVTKYLMKKLK